MHTFLAQSSLLPRRAWPSREQKHAILLDLGVVKHKMGTCAGGGYCGTRRNAAIWSCYWGNTGQRANTVNMLLLTRSCSETGPQDFKSNSLSFFAAVPN